ncbi:MAG: DUF4058 family protein [Gemmataceae bacterium]|nr:DUF4058 family protein [Gemmataceae bacterium]
MPSPFPGMDPYLEDPAVWPGVHANLIVAIQELLNQKIRPNYVARVEERVYMETEGESGEDHERIPDVRVDEWPGPKPHRPAQAAAAVAIAEPVFLPHGDPVRERRVEVVRVATRRLVTVIEVVSPSNKRSGSSGRASFLDKRDEVLASSANWVEIDLLRAGIPHPGTRRLGVCEYYVYSSPRKVRPNAVAWPIRIDEPLPVVGIPLKAADPDAPLDLQQALTLAYDRGAYDATIDYTEPPVPPLPSGLAKWANKLLKQRKLR